MLVELGADVEPERVDGSRWTLRHNIPLLPPSSFYPALSLSHTLVDRGPRCDSERSTSYLQVLDVCLHLLPKPAAAALEQVAALLDLPGALAHDALDLLHLRLQPREVVLRALVVRVVAHLLRATHLASPHRRARERANKPTPLYSARDGEALARVVHARAERVSRPKRTACDFMEPMMASWLSYFFSIRSFCIWKLFHIDGLYPDGAFPLFCAWRPHARCP